MSVLVRFGGHKAILRAGRWISASAGWEQRLNAATRRWFTETGGPGLREADQEFAVAREMAAQFQGTIQVRLRAASRASNRAFMAQRQMELDFSSAPAVSLTSPAKARRASAGRR
jgi:hypothetical protein